MDALPLPEIRSIGMFAAALAAFGAAYFLLIWLAERKRLRDIGFAAARAERIEEDLRREHRGTLMDRTTRRLRRAGYSGDPAPLLAGMGFLVLSLAAVLSVFGFSESAAATASLLVSPLLALAALRFATARRRAKGSKQMLTLLRAAMLHVEAGLSPTQAFQRAAEQVGSPLREDVLRAIANKIGGTTISEAFQPIADTYPSEATDLLTAALDINDRLGASLSPALRQADEILTERQDLAAEATAELASSRGEFIGITAVVSFVAVLLARQPTAVLAYQTPLGITLLAVGIGNYALGVARAVRMFTTARTGGRR